MISSVPHPSAALAAMSYAELIAVAKGASVVATAAAIINYKKSLNGQVITEAEVCYLCFCNITQKYNEQRTEKQLYQNNNFNSNDTFSSIYCDCEGRDRDIDCVCDFVICIWSFYCW